jgi:glycosyltransferase involved in cell wall biosynthesis
MRVAVVLEQCLSPVPGGTGRYARELTAALAATAGPGDSVTSWTAWHRDLEPARLPGVAGPRRLPLGARALAQAWQRGRGPAPGRADVVHAPTLLLPPRRSHARLVVTIHDAVPWTHPETLTAHGARWHRAMGRRAVRTADAVLVPTAAVAGELSRQLPAAPLQVVGEGVASSIAVAPPDAAERAQRLGLPDRFALCVGTLEPRKGLDVALAALRDEQWPGLPLLVVGPTGWGDIRIPDGAARMLGRLSDEDLATVLQRATVLLAPSREEGFGLPVLEAMAHGVPAIVSDIPALVEVGRQGVLPVPVGDPAALSAAAARLAADDEFRVKLGTAGRARAADFSWNSAARACWQIYRDLVDAPKPRSVARLRS